MSKYKKYEDVESSLLRYIDSELLQVALHSLDYAFTNSQPREEDAFGLDMGGRMMLIPAIRLRELVAMLNEVYAPPS